MGQKARRIEFDVEAIALSAICIFLWLSLLSHDAGDSLGKLPPPLSYIIAVDNAVHPPNPEIRNVCGWFGALTANILIQSFGSGSLLIAIGLSVLSVWLFRVQTNYVPPLRQIGWLLIVLGGTTLLSMLQVSLPFSPMVGAGGYLGAMTSTFLQENFALLGAFILTLTILVSGILLSTDYVIVGLFGWLVISTARMVSKTARKKLSLPPPPRLFGRRLSAFKGKSDVEGGLLFDNNLPIPGSLPPVKISGRNLNVSGESQETVGSAISNAAPGQPSRLTQAAKSAFTGWLGKSSENSSTAVLEEQTDSRQIQDQDFTAAEAETIDDQTEDELPLDSRGDSSEGQQLELTAEDGEKIQLRADPPHSEPPDPVEPKVRPPKAKKGKDNSGSDSLANLDDTKLPPGADEYVLPGIELLSPSDDIDFEAQTIEVRRKAKILESTFKNFGFNVRVVEIETGPVIAQYEIELEAGLRLSKITSLADDIAIALRVPSVRIVAPIPGKNTVGIEVPNETRQVVRLREVIEEMGAKGKKAKIPLFLGKDVSGNPLIADLATLPHLLIAGRTGTGKSVCLNAIVSSILMTRRPDEVRMLMIDPKMVEMIGYARLPHLMHPVVTDMRKAEAILAWAVDKMEERYSLLARAGVRHLSSYNELDREELLERMKPESPDEAEAIPDHLPFIVIVADEMADLMMTAGKDVEQHIIRLAQKSRAVGIHLVLATQKPTVDVITGLIKSNLPARIAFQVASRTDSRVVLDEMGADKLLGNGDMLFLWPGTSTLLRGQGTYLSDEEINRVVEHCSTGEQNFVTELVNLKIKDDSEDEPAPTALKKRDDLYAAAVDVVVREGRGSCSLLQRALGIGYGRAARLIDYMAEDGIVGQYAGSQAREVIISLSDWEAMQSLDAQSSETTSSVKAPSGQSRSNKIRPIETENDDEDSLNDEPLVREVPPTTKNRLRPTSEAFRPLESSDFDDSDDFADEVEYEDVED